MAHTTLEPIFDLNGVTAVILAIPLAAQIFEVDIPQNQLQGLLYVDYAKGVEAFLQIDVEFQDINVPGEWFHESAKLDLATMEQANLFHKFSATRKVAIPFPISYRYTKIRVTVKTNVDSNNAVVKVWFNFGNFVDDPLPEIMTKERPAGEGWELPLP